MTRSVTVIGAGIVGLSCALALQRDGCAVTLVDRAEPGMGASFGNAGMIQTGSVLTLAQPGLLGRLPGMMLDPEGPLVLPWSRVPRLLPWLLSFIRASRPAEAERISSALAALLGHATDAFRILAGETVLSRWVRDRGELYVFPDATSYAAAAAKFPVYHRYGITCVPLADEALRRFEPALSERYRQGYYLPGSRFVVDPLSLSRSLFELFLAAGGDYVTEEISGLARQGTGLRIETASGSRDCDCAVLAAGAASKQLAATLGLHVPLEPLRGYHVMLPDDGISLAGPVIDGSMNIAATPMAGGIRVAGTLEFARPGGAPRWRRAEMLAPMAHKMLPGLSTRITSRWFGDRPGTPDGLPVLGPTPGIPGLICAFGHGMLGLTLGPATGLLIADNVGGRSPRVDLTPFSPTRFGIAA